MNSKDSIVEVMSGSPYRDYLYSYPHKTAYRPLAPPRPLESLWANENTDSLFLYIHVPFCEMRCGFCNLFTTPKPAEAPVSDFVDALERQARVVRSALAEPRFARMAVGGGTPTFLDSSQLERLFDVAENIMGADLAAIPISVETSPETGHRERLEVLLRRGVDRISIGVQSFLESEVASIGRAQTTPQVLATLKTVRELGFATLNIDLMYGLPHQTHDTWRSSLDQAISLSAEEVYIYPLYVRPLTGLGRQQRQWDDARLDFYRRGRDQLLEAGYRQVSMRMFRRSDAPDVGGPVYKCQSDGMLGLGVGARSYTDSLHYSSEYAVANRGVKEIIGDFSSAAESRFAFADYGVELSGEDRRRRFVILSLLERAGLSLPDFRDRFGTDALTEFPELGELTEAGAAARIDDRVVLTDAGMERSDAIGPWLRSSRVNQLMSGYQLR